MQGIEQGDRVQIVNAWPENATGRVRHFAKDGSLAYVDFDKRHKFEGVWHKYNWYSRANLAKLTDVPAEPEPAIDTGDESAFLNALFPERFASLDDAMMASGADSPEF